jgi:2-polyprenyl-3-methyl-5-hydroxy-6-metoxy-1,4-benzoquinol methylase
VSAAAYDQLAPHYRELAQQRGVYLDAVDRFIVEHAGAPVGSLLDVGAGDGVRGVAVAQRLGARRIVLCEPGTEFARRCEALGVDEVWWMSAEQLPDAAPAFDIILCLWNVLGHLPDHASRVAALTRMKALLNPSGSIFFDVNNRHNAHAYGRMRVWARRVLDYVMPDERRGDAAYSWRIAGKVIPAQGHLFTPAEVAALLRGAGLRVLQRTAVDYVTGVYARSPRAGQLVYQAGA